MFFFFFFVKEILDLLAILQKTKNEPFVGLGDGGDQRERNFFSFH